MKQDDSEEEKRNEKTVISFLYLSCTSTIRWEILSIYHNHRSTLFLPPCSVFVSTDRNAFRIWQGERYLFYLLSLPRVQPSHSPTLVFPSAQLSSQLTFHLLELLLPEIR